MKKDKLVVLLCNTRKKYPDPENLESQLEADFYDPPAVEWMVKHLENLGLKVRKIEANEEAYFQLYKLKKEIAMVYNDAEGVRGLDREAQLPAMMEMLGIPYTTSSPLTQALVLNKAKTKEVLKANNIPVLPHKVIKPGERAGVGDLKFPVIVKPISEGSSSGITNKSVVKDQAELEKQVVWVTETFREAALIEPFLTGREFSIAMLGNPPEVLPIIESDHTVLPENYLPIDSLEVKWYFEEEASQNNLICPAKMTNELEEKIKKMSLEIWKALDIRDLCRIDIRCDTAEQPYVLEVNSPPGMIPPEVSTTAYFPLAARVAGMDYEELLKKILIVAADRYGIELF